MIHQTRTVKIPTVGNFRPGNLAPLETRGRSLLGHWFSVFFFLRRGGAFYSILKRNLGLNTC